MDFPQSAITGLGGLAGLKRRELGSPTRSTASAACLLAGLLL